MGMCFQHHSIRKEMETLLWMFNDTRSCSLLVKSHFTTIILLRKMCWITPESPEPAPRYYIIAIKYSSLCIHGMLPHIWCMRSENGSELKHLSVPFSINQASRMLNVRRVTSLTPPQHCHQTLSHAGRRYRRVSTWCRQLVQHGHAQGWF